MFTFCLKYDIINWIDKKESLICPKQRKKQRQGR